MMCDPLGKTLKRRIVIRFVSIQSPQDSDLEELTDLESFDKGMGTNFENIRNDLLEKTRERARERGFRYDPHEEEYKVFYSREEEKAVLLAESWGESTDVIAEVTAFECSRRINGKTSCPQGRAIKPGNYSEVEINEGALRGAAEYLENKRTRESI